MKKNLIKKALVTTAFPYLNGKLHQGHRYSYSIFEAISKILVSSGYEVKKPFSFHTTGIALISNPQKYIQDPSLSLRIKKEILKNNWTPLLDYYKKDIVSKFKKVGIKLDRSFYEYTHNSKRYLFFLDSCFQKLARFIKKDDHKVIFCPKCNVVLGEHDRSAGQSAYILEKEDLKKGYRIQGTDFVLSQKVTCKCGTDAIVETIKDWFIDYHKVVSRDSLIREISSLPVDIFKVLLNKYDSLRPWCLTRNKGLGPRFYFDPEKILEPLSDSAFFPFYYLLLQKEFPSVDYLKDINPSLFENHYHIIGKDLIENHVLFMVMWELFFLGRRVTTFIVTGHLLLEGEKMSKTKGNIIPFEQNLFSIPDAFWSVNSYKDYTNSVFEKQENCSMNKTKKELIITKHSLVNRNTEFHRLRRRDRETSFFNFNNILLQNTEEEDRGLLQNQNRLKQLRSKITYLLKKNKKIAEVHIPLFYFNYSYLSVKDIDAMLLDKFKGILIKRRVVEKPFILFK